MKKWSRYRGVSWNKKLNRWVVQLFYKGERYYCGAYIDEEYASHAYVKKRTELENQ
jgi:hypothetical protein